MNKRWLGWHWLQDNKRLRYRDGRLVDDGEIVEAGKTYEAVGPILMCCNGMHASERIIDALKYAPGAILCRVELEGEIIGGREDKAAARRRTVLWMLDATNILHQFACRCAEDALLEERKAGREPDSSSWAAIEAKRKWLRGEITNGQLRQSRNAAADAANAADAAHATHAAYAAHAATHAIHAANAAYAAAHAADGKTRSMQNQWLEDMVMVAYGKTYLERKPNE